MRKSIQVMLAALGLLTAHQGGTTPAFVPHACSEPEQDFRPIHREPPAYPHTAIMMCLDGSVHLAFTITKNGRIDAIEVIRSEPPGIFDRAAINAARTWQYEPDCKNGQPTEARTSIAIDFYLEEEVRRDCPAEAPELDDDVLELLGEIGALHAITAEGELEGRTTDERKVMLAKTPTPSLDEDALRVWHYHRDMLYDQIVLSQISVRELGEASFGAPFSTADLQHSDPDLTDIRGRLEDIRHALDEHFDRQSQWHAELLERYNNMVRDTRYDDDVLALLVHSFIGGLDEQLLQLQVQPIEAEFAAMQSMVELLVREHGRWQATDTKVEFDDPGAQAEFRQLVLTVHRLRGDAITERRNSLRGFEDYFDAD